MLQKRLSRRVIDAYDRVVISELMFYRNDLLGRKFVDNMSDIV